MNNQVLPMRVVKRFSIGVQVHETHADAVRKMIQTHVELVSRLEALYDRADKKHGDALDENFVRMRGDLFCQVFFEMQEMIDYLKWIAQQTGIPQHNYTETEEVEA